VQPSPIEFTAGPATETPIDGESEDDDDDDDEDEEDIVAEAGQDSVTDAVVIEQPRINDVDTEAELPPRNVSWFDGRQKCTGFIDVWWLFDDGGLELNFVIILSYIKCFYCFGTLLILLFFDFPTFCSIF